MLNSLLRTLNYFVLSFIAPLEGNIGSWLRYQYYKRRLRKCEGYFYSSAGFFVENPRKVSISKGCSFNRGVLISASKTITIGNNVLIGPYSVLRDGNHKYEHMKIPIKDQGHDSAEILIENNVWLGSHVVVLKNVSISEGSIIGAHSLVNKSVPSNEVWAGCPAKMLRR